MQSAQVQQIQHQIPAGASVILKMSEIPSIGEWPEVICTFYSH